MAPGPLGSGSVTGRSTPVLASEQPGVAIGVSTRDYAACILRADRSTACWGGLNTYAPGG
ncbi:MAG: hypothetical protein RJA98_1701 [Pseudomonadota bacterium]|jgi:hypothetical protein